MSITTELPVQIVPQCECDRLLEKQLQAKRWLRKHPWAWSMQVKWQHHFRQIKARKK